MQKFSCLTKQQSGPHFQEPSDFLLWSQDLPFLQDLSCQEKKENPVSKLSFSVWVDRKQSRVASLYQEETKIIGLRVMLNW